MRAGFVGILLSDSPAGDWLCGVVAGGLIVEAWNGSWPATPVNLREARLFGRFAWPLAVSGWAAATAAAAVGVWSPKRSLGVPALFGAMVVSYVIAALLRTRMTEEERRGWQFFIASLGLWIALNAAHKTGLVYLRTIRPAFALVAGIAAIAATLLWAGVSRRPDEGGAERASTA